MNNPIPTRAFRGTLSIASSTIKSNPDNSLTEDTDLINYFHKVIKEIDQAMKGSCEFGEICIVPGRYMVSIYSAPGLDAIPCELETLLKKLSSDKINLEENSLREAPETATTCGVDTPTVSIFQAMQSKNISVNPILLAFPDGTTQALPTASSEALMALPVHKERKAKKVDGEVTSLNRDGDGGCNIQISGDSTWLSVNIPLNEAWLWVSERKKITGRAHWSENAYVIESYTIENSLFF